MSIDCGNSKVIVVGYVDFVVLLKKFKKNVDKKVFNWIVEIKKEFGGSGGGKGGKVEKGGDKGLEKG